GRQLRGRGRALRNLDAHGGAFASPRPARRARGGAHRQWLLLPPSDRARLGEKGAARGAGVERRAGDGRVGAPAHCRQNLPKSSAIKPPLCWGQSAVRTARRTLRALYYGRTDDRSADESPALSHAFRFGCARGFAVAGGGGLPSGI